MKLPTPNPHYPTGIGINPYDDAMEHKGNYPYSQKTRWYTGTDTTELPPNWKFRYVNVTDHSVEMTADTPTGFAYINQSKVDVEIVIYTLTYEHLQTTINQFKTYNPHHEPGTGTKPVAFWYHTQNGPRQIVREIEVPKWDTIKHNYPQTADIHNLMNLPEQPTNGNLIILHGPPGTGKTYAIRSMIAENTKANFHFVVDPEQFFGQASYMLEAALSEHWQFEHNTTNIFIFEDTGELLSTTAKEHTGQALSRLLNMSDGVMGQGLNMYYLFSTNEKLGTLHKAATRQGRLNTQILVDKFNTHQANKWLKNRGSEKTVDQPQTLAELYAITAGQKLHGEVSTGNARQVGFAQA